MSAHSDHAPYFCFLQLITGFTNLRFSETSLIYFRRLPLSHLTTVSDKDLIRVLYNSQSDVKSNTSLNPDRFL